MARPVNLFLSNSSEENESSTNVSISLNEPSNKMVGGATISERKIEPKKKHRRKKGGKKINKEQLTSQSDDSINRCQDQGICRHGNVSKFFGPRSGHLSSA